MLGCVLSLVSAWHALAWSTEIFRSITQDAAPSVDYAADLGSSIQDMDAKAADFILTADRSLIGVHETDRGAMHVAQRRIRDDMFKARSNITFEGEADVVTSIEDAYATYLALLTKAFYDLDEARPQTALVTYLKATEVLHQTVSHAVDRLESLNTKQVFRLYDADQGQMHRLVVRSSGLLVLGTILALFLMALRTHRVLNIGLLLALLLAAFGATLTVTALHTCEVNLTRVVVDAFRSIQLADRIKHYSYHANADAARFLLDAGHAQQWQGTFDGRVAMIETDLSRAAQNITFPGEADAVAEMQEAWKKFIALDAQMRTMWRAGQHAEATALAVHDTHQALENFEAARLRFGRVNREKFQQYSNQATATLVTAHDAIGWVLLLTALFALIGIRQRLSDL